MIDADDKELQEVKKLREEFIYKVTDEDGTI